jgi:two-component system OmpR family sensor kinase
VAVSRAAPAEGVPPAQLGSPPGPRSANPAGQHPGNAVTGASRRFRLARRLSFGSARSRILGWSVLLLAGGIAVSTAVTQAVLVHEMNAQVNSELSHEVAEFRTLAAHGSARHGPGAVQAMLTATIRQVTLERDTVLLGLTGTTVVSTSGNYDPATIGAGPGLRASWSGVRSQSTGSGELAIGPIRYTAIPVAIPGDPARGTFVAAVLVGPGQATNSRVMQVQLEVGGLALLAGTLLAWLIAGRVLRPVRDTTELARRITDTDISGRIPVRGGNEISELADTFNRMLDRLEAALVAQRRFLADAGHELRTPLTIVQGNLDTLKPGTAEDAETLAIVADELARMGRMVTDLALLTGSEQVDFLQRRPTSLEQLTSSVLAKARRLDDRPWSLAGTAKGIALLDPQRITQALMQLAANASEHTPPGTPVEIGSALAAGRVEFIVADHGAGIPHSERQRIFGRFARLDTRRTSGTGLGLSIVAAIAAAHGGTVLVEDTPGGGSTFRISTPYVPVAGESSGDQGSRR